jgi:hypothetical protein
MSIEVAKTLKAGDRLGFTWKKVTIKGTIIKISEDFRALIKWDNCGESWHNVSNHISEVEQQQWIYIPK